MPRYELDIPNPTRVLFDKLPPKVQSVIREDNKRLTDEIPSELIMGHLIHMLALVDGFNHVGPNNKDILPKVTQPNPSGYVESIGLIAVRIHNLTRGNEPIESMLMYRLPECAPLLFEVAVDDIVRHANETIREMGLPLIPER